MRSSRPVECSPGTRATAEVNRARSTAVSNTWLIDDRPWTVAERMIWLRGLPQSMSRRLTAWMRARRGCNSAGIPVPPARNS